MAIADFTLDRSIIRSSSEEAIADAVQGIETFKNLLTIRGLNKTGSDQGDINIKFSEYYGASANPSYYLPEILEKDYQKISDDILASFTNYRYIEEFVLSLFSIDEEVLKYLREYPFIMKILPEAYSKIEVIFGSESVISLDLLTDPETENHQMLFINIQGKFSVEEALNMSDRFDEEWLLNQPGYILERINFLPNPNGI